LRHEALHFI